MKRFAQIVSRCVLAVLVMTLPQSAFADTKYGAIAFNKRTGAVGFSNRYDRRGEAEERALEECGRGCSVIVWVRNECAALAAGSDLGYGWGNAPSRDYAERIAMKNCRANSERHCEIKAWTCSGS